MTRSDYGYAYQTGFRPTVRFLLSKGVSRDTAEETAQAAWTRGWERIDQLREEEFVSTWINSIALNLYRRRAWAERRTQPLSDLIGGSNINMAAIDLARVLKSCGSSDRDLLLQQLHGLTTSEIARRIGASEVAVRIRLMRARRTARARVNCARELPEG